MIQRASFQSFFCLVVLYVVIVQADKPCTPTTKGLDAPTQPIEINMRSPVGFVASIMKARQKINKFVGINDKGLTCYATDGWAMTITRPMPEGGAQPAGAPQPASGQQMQHLVHTFPMKDDVYLAFQESDKKDNYGGEDEWMWSPSQFDQMMQVPMHTTPAQGSVRRLLFSIAEAIRFDWVRNRIAQVIEYEKKWGKKMEFKMPKKLLLNAWSGLFDKRLGIDESSVNDDVLRGQPFEPKWDKYSPADLPKPFCDDFGADYIKKGSEKRAASCESGWAAQAQLEEALALTTRVTKDEAKLASGAVGEVEHQKMLERINTNRTKATEIITRVVPILQQKIAELMQKADAEEAKSKEKYSKLTGAEKQACKRNAEALRKEATEIEHLIRQATQGR